MKRQGWIRFVMLVAWGLIMYFGTTAYYHLYTSYPEQQYNDKPLQTQRELWTRSFFSSVQLFAFNIDSNAVDGWKQESLEQSPDVSQQLHLTAIFAGLWTVFFIVLLLFKSWWMWIVRHLFSRWIRENLYVFWGINRRAILLAHELGKKDGWRNIVFVVQPEKEYEDTAEGLKLILQRSKYREALKREIGSNKASILIAQRPITELSELSYWKAWLKMGLGLMGRYIMRTTQHIHILILGENEVQNMNDALKLSSMSLWPTFFPFKSRKLTIHCHARRSNANRVIEDIQENNIIKVIDSSHLAIELLKQNVDNHPVKFVNLSTQYPGTVDSPFRCLIIGFSECGQDALRFLYEYGAFVGSENMDDLEKDSRSPFYCDIVDKQLDASAARWMHHSDEMFHSKNSDGSERIAWHPIDYSSPEFYQNVLDPHIHELNYVVIAVGNDQAGITLAADILRYAIKCGRVDYNNPGNKFRIYVRSYDPDKNAFLQEIAKYYNREGEENEEIFIRIFGGENDIYTMGMLIDDELETQAKQYADNYNKASKNVEEEIKKSEENESAKESKQDPQTADEKKTDNPYNEPDSPLKSKLDKRRKDSQNFANALHFQTKEEIKRFYDQEGIQLPLVRLAQVEHLRWWAAHEIMGYRSDGRDNEEKLILRYVHNCMKPWKDLDQARKYDFLTFSALYKPEEIAQAILCARDIYTNN